MRHVLLFVQATLFLLTLWVGPNVSWAQTELTDENRATAFVDVDIKRLLENEHFKDIPFDTLLSDRGLFLPPVEFESAVRFVFAGQSPDFETLAGYNWQEDIPFSFYIEVTFDSPEGTKNFSNVMDRLPEVEINGISYRRPPEEENVSNCLILVTESQFVFGTDDYVLNASQSLLTERLQQQMDQLPKDRIIRAGVDCVGGKKFLEQFFEQNRSDFIPPEVQMFAQPIAKLDSIVLSVDLEDKNLLDLIAHSPDEKSASKFHASISQMLNMAKISVSMLSTQLETDEQKACFKELTKQLEADVEGTVTTVDVDQPEGFVEMVSAITSEMRREALRRQKMNEFRQVGLAILNFESAHQRFPFNVDEKTDWSSELSWRARVLPFMEYNGQWEEMDMAQAWDSDVNKKMVDRMPEIYGDDGKKTRMAWIKSDVERFGDIRDGSSNTIMLLECPDGIPWLEPKDLSVLEAIRMVKNLKDGEELMAVRYDCSVYRIINEFSANELRALFSPAGGEVIDFDR